MKKSSIVAKNKVYMISIVFSILIILPLVAAITPQEIFRSWIDGTGETSVGKILIAILIGAVIFSITEIMPFFNKNMGARWAFTIAATVLSTWFLKLEDIRAMLMSWNSLGLTLGIILPFIVLGYFSFVLARDSTLKTTSGLFNKMIGYLVWILFFGANIYKVNANDQWDNPLSWTILLINLIIILALPAFFAWVHKEEIAEELEKSAATFKKAKKAINELANMTEETAKS